MKTILIAAMGILLLTSLPIENIDAQPSQKEKTSSVEKKNGEIKVYGNCSMCKTRIEKAAREVKGVQKIKWNQETKILTFTYKPNIATIDDLAKKMAEVGHDTEKFKASDEVYNGLHSCCKYR